MTQFELGRTPHDAIWNNPIGITKGSLSHADYSHWVVEALHASTGGYPEMTLLTTQDESLIQSMECLGLPQYPPRRDMESKSALFIEPKIYHAYEHHGINFGQLQVNLLPRIQRGVGEAEWDSTSHRWDGLGDAVRRISGAISSIDESLGDPITPYDHDVPPGFVWDDTEYIVSLDALLKAGTQIIHPIIPWVDVNELQSPNIQKLLETYAMGISDITSPISVECGYAYVDVDYGNIDYHPVTMSSYFLPQWYTKLSGSVSVDSMNNPIGRSIQRLETGDGLFERWNVKYMRPNRSDTADYMEVKIGTRTGKFFQYEGVEALPNIRTVHGFQHTDTVDYYENARMWPGTTMIQLFADIRADVVALAIQRMQNEAQSASAYLTEMLCSKLRVGRGDRTRVRTYVEAILSSFPASLASLP